MEHPEFGPVTWANLNEYLVWISKQRKEESKNASDAR